MPRGARDFDPAALRAWRKRRGLTQQHLANTLGVDRTYVVQWERDPARRDAIAPTPATLARIAGALDAPPAQLISTSPDQATLATLRGWAGLSRSQLAARRGLTTSMVGRIERQKARASPRS